MTGSDRRYAPPRRRPRTLSPEEEALWAHVTRHDERLNHPSGITVIIERPETTPPLTRKSSVPPPSLPSLRESPTAAPQRGVYDNIDRRTAERFRKGQKKAEAVLDLHGMSQPLAYQELVSFIENSYERGRRVLLVITGKGKGGGEGVLRAALPRWFEEPALARLVLAFDFAQRKDGGDGAYYVLLRRKRLE